MKDSAKIYHLYYKSLGITLTLCASNFYGNFFLSELHIYISFGNFHVNRISSLNLLFLLKTSFCCASTRHGNRCPKQVKLITISQDFQIKVMQSKGCFLLCSMALINISWGGSLDICKLHGLVPCFGQDGYKTQVPQLPIYTYRYTSHTYYFCLLFKIFLAMLLKDVVILIHQYISDLVKGHTNKVIIYKLKIDPFYSEDGQVFLHFFQLLCIIFVIILQN